MKVLTAKGGEFQVSDEMRNMLALLEDGRLIVAKTYATNPHVRGFISRLNSRSRASSFSTSADTSRGSVSR